MSNLKVKTSEGLDKKTEELCISMTKASIKVYVQEQIKKDKSFKFASLRDLISKGKGTEKFFEFRHVCMNCGDVQDMPTYAIAQNAMGNKINYTCECGHITVLPQRIY